MLANCFPCLSVYCRLVALSSFCLLFVMDAIQLHESKFSEQLYFSVLNEVIVSFFLSKECQAVS